MKKPGAAGLSKVPRKESNLQPSDDFVRGVSIKELARRTGGRDGLQWPHRDGLKWPHFALVDLLVGCCLMLVGGAACPSSRSLRP